VISLVRAFLRRPDIPFSTLQGHSNKSTSCTDAVELALRYGPRIVESFWQRPPQCLWRLQGTSLGLQTLSTSPIMLPCAGARGGSSCASWVVNRLVQGVRRLDQPPALGWLRFSWSFASCLFVHEIRSVASWPYDCTMLSLSGWSAALSPVVRCCPALVQRRFCTSALTTRVD